MSGSSDAVEPNYETAGARRARSIRIVSNGAPPGTHVTDMDGNKVPGIITGITWACHADGFATATITYALVEVDLVGELPDPTNPA